jgi:hypothetical protein
VLACDGAGSAGVAVKDLLLPGGNSARQQLAYALWAEGVACTVAAEGGEGGKEPAAKKAKA